MCLRVSRSIFNSFFNPDPEVLQELASKVGPKKRGPAGPAQMAAKTYSTAEDGGLSGA